MYLKRVPETTVLTSMDTVSVTQMKQNPIISIWVARIFQKTIFIRHVTAQKGQLVTVQKGGRRIWVTQKGPSVDREPSKQNANGPCDRAEGLRDCAEGSGHAYELLINFPIVPQLGTTDYSLACGDVYATFMNEQTEEGAKLKEFLNRGNAPVNRMITASFNGLISEEELEAY